MDWPRDTPRPRPVRLAEAPALWGVDDFLSAAEIAALLELFGDEAFVAAHADLHGSDACGFLAEIRADRHPALHALGRRLEAALGCRPALPLTLRFRYYPEDHGHPPHTDAYAVGEHQLALSVLITLIAPDEGGETRFLDARPAPVAVAPRPGRLIAWTSALAGGADDPASRHDGAPVRRGAKAVLLAFFYLRAADIDGRLELSLRP